MAMEDPKCQRCFVELFQTDGTEWVTSRTDLSSIEKICSQPRFCLLLARAQSIRECNACCERLSRLFKIPSFFWTWSLQRSNGYSGCEDTYTGNRTFEGHNTWFKFQVKQTLEYSPLNDKDYVWHKVNVFTRWLSPEHNLVISFDTPAPLRSRLPASLLQSLYPLSQHDPYWIHEVFIHEVMALQNESVWGIRRLIRETELHRPSSISQPAVNYDLLHNIARHSIHSSESIDVSVDTTKQIIAQHDHFTERHSEGADAFITSHRIMDRLSFQVLMLRNLKARAQANQQRLNNEITLAFNTIAQYDSRTAVTISRATQTDSASMKTVAVLTMTFLPATFVSAIFGMNFFNFRPATGDQPQAWSVSDKLWVYWIFAVPLTAITVLVWLWWQRSFIIKAVGDP